MPKLESTAQTVTTVVSVLILSALVGVGGTLAYENRNWFHDNVGQFWRPDKWVAKAQEDRRYDQPWAKTPTGLPNFGSPVQFRTLPGLNPQIRTPAFQPQPYMPGFRGR